VTVKHKNSKMALHLVVLAVVAKGEIKCFNQNVPNSAKCTKAGSPVWQKADLI
jgi:hypothetical protein